MPTAQPTHDEDANKPRPILRWAKPLGNGQFETSVLLFQGRGNYLQGFINVKGEKRQVVAHLNERKPDPETGEVKPNYLTLSEPHGQGNDTKWTQIGHGNAMNRRNDGKPVYFDEIILNVGGEVLRARVTEHASHDLHRQLGFTSDRLERPAYEPRQGAGDTRDAESSDQEDRVSDSASSDERSMKSTDPSPAGAEPSDQPTAAATSEEGTAKKADALAAREESAGAKKSRRRKPVTTH